MTTLTKQYALMMPEDARAAWEIWKWMQEVSDRLWNIHADAFMDFDQEEHAPFESLLPE